jgi:putative SOS response-associated peptidase YedK
VCGRSVFSDTFRARELLNVTHLGPDLPLARRDAKPGDSVMGVLNHGVRRYLWNFWWGFHDDGTRHNARIENVTSVQLWQTPWEAKQRCILPVDSFYEGPRASPTQFSDAWGGMLAVAGLWITTESGNRVTMLTRPATEFVEEHASISRMPVILPRANWDHWLLGNKVDVDDLITYEPQLQLAA